MAIRNIVTIGDDILRKVSRKIDKVDKRIIQLLDDMLETMYAAEGAGLAAPQVGILRRVAVIDIGDGPLEMINPEIISEEGEQLCYEGCLSIPGERHNIRRPQKVVVRALNRNGKEFELTAEEFLAQAVCHEIDHLDGILYIDKIIPEDDVDGDIGDIIEDE